MCGRFTQTQSADRIALHFGLEAVPDLEPRYNIAPTQGVPVVLKTDTGRQLAAFHWGLVPSWAKDAKMGNRMINARAETVAERPAFRNAFRRRRCLVVADGFYEWQRRPDGKQPYFFYLPDAEGGRSPFAFAGLWEHWAAPDGSELLSCTLLTTAANETLRPVHDRMPVILAPENYARWLDLDQPPNALMPLLGPYADDAMAMVAVSSQVNSPRNDRPELLEQLVDNRSI